MSKISVGCVRIRKKERQYVNEVLNSDRISMGPKVNQFEDRFMEVVGTKHAVSVSSGGAADTIAIASLIASGRASRGDEVIVPALSFIAVPQSIVHAGMKPVFVDIEPETFNIDAGRIEKAITQKTKAIMPIHSFGFPARMDEIKEIAEKHGLSVIEDAAEAHNATYKGKRVGGIGDIGTFSFYVAHIITSGEGGMCTTNDDTLAETMRSLRAHGRACACKTCVLLTSNSNCPMRFKKEYTQTIDTRFYFPNMGYSCKMNEFEAAIGLAQLERLGEVVEKRRANRDYLNKGLKDLEERLGLPKDPEFGEMSPLCYPITVKEGNKDGLVEHMEKNDIETRPMFGSAPTQQPCFAYLGYKEGDFPVSEEVGRTGFYIGCHQELTREELDRVIDCIREYYRRE